MIAQSASQPERRAPKLPPTTRVSFPVLKPPALPRPVFSNLKPLAVPKLGNFAAQASTRSASPNPWIDPALAPRMNATIAASTKAFTDLTSAASALQRAQVGLSRATTDFAAQVVRAMQQMKTIQVTATTNLDGRKIAETVTTHQTHAMTGPRATARPDTRAALMPAAAGYSY